MKKNHLNATIILWLAFFLFVSLGHSVAYHVWLSGKPGFYSNVSDIIIIGLILTFASICVTFLLFIWMIYLINKPEKSAKTFLLINAIPLIFGVIAFILMNDVVASWNEAIIYVGSYLLAFLAVMNNYFLKLKRAEMIDPEILDQIDK